jgi:hypothetical protein
MTFHEDLIQRYVDDCNGLSEADLQTLFTALRDDPQLVQQLREQLELSEVLRQKLAIDAGNFPAQIELRIQDYLIGKQRREVQTDSLEQNVESEIQRQKPTPPLPPPTQSPPTQSPPTQSPPAPTPPALPKKSPASIPTIAVDTQKGKSRRRGSFRFWLVATLLIAIVGYYGLVLRGNDATLLTATGDVTIQRGDETLQFLPAMSLRSGDQLKIGSGGYAILQYRDGTELKLHDRTEIKIGTGWGKRVVVGEGNLLATVSPQRLQPGLRIETPSATAVIIGTELLVSSRGEETRVDVSHGKVELHKNSSSESVVLEKNDYGVVNATEVYKATMKWPSNRNGLVAATVVRESQLQLASTTGSQWFYSTQSNGEARLDPNGQLTFGGGRFYAPEISEELLRACRESNALTIECTLLPAELMQQGPARIVTFSRDSHGFNFALCHEDPKLILKLQSGEELRYDLFQFADREQEIHVVVTHGNGETSCYVDSKRVFHAAAANPSDFKNWKPYEFVLGNEWSVSRSWHGSLRNVAIYNRVLTQSEIHENYQQSQ